VALDGGTEEKEERKKWDDRRRRYRINALTRRLLRPLALTEKPAHHYPDTLENSQ
jgi:hypothetical protein